MKLIGGHDYYDGAGYGVDETVLFLRKKQMRLEDIDEQDDHPFRQPAPWSFHRSSDDDVRGFLSPFFVVVAGKLYPGLEERRISTACYGFHPDEVVYHYELSEALEALDRYEDRMSRPLLYTGTGRTGVMHRRACLKEHFNSGITREQTDWLIDNRITVLSSSIHPYDYKAVVGIRTNHACLKDLQFFKKLDPCTAHMEIQGWISGVLPFNKDVVEISDIDRIRKAGFDTRKSFRKAPEKKRKRA
jgi:hypothetical protein